LKFLRGTKFDLFSYTQERKAERKLLSDYCLLIEKIIEPLTVAETSRSRYNLIVEIASLPKNIKGYGHIKMKAIVEYHKQKEKLLAQFN
jgi:indolepyruvate ferredoxin oxidoreductase